MNAYHTFLFGVFEGSESERSLVWPHVANNRFAEHRGVGWGEILQPEISLLRHEVHSRFAALFPILGIVFSAALGSLLALALCRGVHPTALGIFANPRVIDFAVTYLGASGTEAVGVSAALVGALLAACIASIMVIVEHVVRSMYREAPWSSSSALLPEASV